MSIVKCSDGKKDRQTGGGSDAVKNSSNDPQERTKKSQESKSMSGIDMRVYLGRDAANNGSAYGAEDY
ncbi:hypothetical protein NECAME_12856 [Necator americanus]|uniref:Uncharacterized protein n=1 Tax=Necator americanus TaxID=51031 RepID=W2T0W5_NECAM|nr:hypothetical protein NECAME_12856 [Necator americanus]ETN74612.1 hypothetical protein NECAME_12856 [Necator americanus]